MPCQLVSYSQFSFKSHFLLHSPQHSLYKPGRHLHLVVVTDKASRGEVAALVARILTRCFLHWCLLVLGASCCLCLVVLPGAWWSKVMSGGWVEVPYWGQAGDGGVKELCLTFISPSSTSNRLFRSHWENKDEKIFCFALAVTHTDMPTYAKIYQIHQISLINDFKKCARWTGSW